MSTAFVSPGNSTSAAEVTHISKHGFWLLLGERELFLSFAHFPWFKTASIAAIQDVEWQHQRHLYWPQLDIDLAVASIEQPEMFPLVAHSPPRGSSAATD
jgi:Protein of unknown function (DUF2442)